jgi:hypothetical protein
MPITTNTISSWFHARFERVVQKCPTMACRGFASDPVLIPNGFLQRARASLAPGSDRLEFVPGYPLLRRPDEDLRHEGTGGFDSDDGVVGAFPESSPREPRL